MSDTLTWLITSTTYGTWLPGDARGFVGRVREKRDDDEPTGAMRVEHDRAGTPYDRDVPGLRATSKLLMKGDPVLLNEDQAEVVVEQFCETATFRGWSLHSASVMANHFHLVVSAPAATSTDQLLRDFKSYASRSLNRRWPKPASGTWWTASGSRRRLPDDRAVEAATNYVWNQYRVLARWRVDSAPSGGREPAVDVPVATHSPSGGREPAVDVPVANGDDTSN